MRIILYLHSSKENSCERAEAAGLTGNALTRAMYLGSEHKMEYEVDPATGLVAVDGRLLAPAPAGVT